MSAQVQEETSHGHGQQQEKGEETERKRRQLWSTGGGEKGAKKMEKRCESKSGELSATLHFCLFFFSLYLGDLHIFSRLSLCIVESPIITDEAISLLKQFCQVIIVICNFFSHILYLHRARLELWLV